MRSIAAMKAERTSGQRPYYSATKLVTGAQVPISNGTATGETFSFVNSTDLFPFHDRIVSSGPINGYDSRSRINATIFWTIQRPRRVRSILCGIQEIKNSSQYLSDPLACTRTLFRTNEKP